MKHIYRTDSDNPDFQHLVSLLDNDLQIRNGEDNPFYAQFNKTTHIRHVVLYYLDQDVMGCGAFKRFDEDKVEIKRMFVRPECRGQGIGREILHELETWAKELHFTSTILETGKKQPEAIRLYEKAGYKLIPNFGPYANVEDSVCMLKEIV